MTAKQVFKQKYRSFRVGQAPETSLDYKIKMCLLKRNAQDETVFLSEKSGRINLWWL